MELKQLLADGHNVTVSISGDDLKAVILDFYAEMRKKEIQQQNRQREEILLSREQAARELGVTLSTLWRWAKNAYLTPVKIGVKAYYRKSDIDSMKEKGVPA